MCLLKLYYMKLAVVITVLAVLFVCSSDAGWIRIRWRRVRDAVKGYVARKAVEYGASLIGKRSASEYDNNMDGMIDQSELESELGTREAKEFLDFADDDGDDIVSIEEFEHALDNIRSR